MIWRVSWTTRVLPFILIRLDKMGVKSQFFRMALFAGFSVFAAVPSFAASGGNHEIKVTLFGQPCTLQGPMDEPVLRLIHAISPEQIYPNFSLQTKPSSVEQALVKLRDNSFHGDLDSYKDRLEKRLEAEAAFLNGLQDTQKLGKADALLLTTKKYVPDTKQKSFELLAKKLEIKDLNATQRKDALEQLFNNYSETMPSDPEEEFHSVIHRMKVQYVCTFEESGDSEGSAD
jgi:hypothetical protein